MKDVTGWIQDLTGLHPTLQTKLLTSIIIILILGLLRRILLRVVWKRTEDVQLRYRWQKSITYAAVILGVFGVVRVWFAGIESLATYLGLITAGLAIALKDLVASIAGWLFILSRRPFMLGDRIQIGQHQGDVIDVRVFKFTLMEVGNWIDAEQSTGRIIHIPNSFVLTEVLANYSRGFQFIWSEIPVLVTYESNWEKAKEILMKIAHEHAEHLTKTAEQRIKEASRRFMIFYGTLTPTVYTTVKDSGILLTIRFLTEPRKRRGSEQTMWEAVLREFAKCDDIDFA
ncbi:MAG: mechanosensitive ion channel, partial [Calditrichia bacterium]